MTYTVHTRSQHAKHGRKFHGPDTHVAVTAAPEGVELPKYLNHRVLAARGIEIKYFGEGYAEHTGPRSMLGKALAAAHAYADYMNNDGDSAYSRLPGAAEDARTSAQAHFNSQQENR